MKPKTPPPGDAAPRVDPAEAARWPIVDARRRTGGPVPRGSIPHEDFARSRKSLPPGATIVFWCG